MRYVNPIDVMDKFMRYLEDYDSEMISKQTALDELQDALAAAKSKEVSYYNIL